MLRRCCDFDARSLVDACITDLAAFRGHARAADDVTFMAVRRC
jgi:serine phosphatase RsbU (regulator of sigma subunit)